MKKGSPIVEHDPFEYIADKQFIAQTFWDCLLNNDPQGALEVLAIHLNAINKLHLARSADISRSTIYHTLKGKNPTIKTIAKLVHCGIADSTRH